MQIPMSHKFVIKRIKVQKKDLFTSLSPRSNSETPRSLTSDRIVSILRQTLITKNIKNPFCPTPNRRKRSQPLLTHDTQKRQKTEIRKGKASFSNHLYEEQKLPDIRILLDFHTRPQNQSAAKPKILSIAQKQIKPRPTKSKPPQCDINQLFSNRNCLQAPSNEAVYKGITRRAFRQTRQKYRQRKHQSNESRAKIAVFAPWDTDGFEYF